MGLHFDRRSMWRYHRKQERAQIRDWVRQNYRIRGKMLSHGMRRISLDARMVEIDTVERAGSNAEGNREDGEQCNKTPT
jgi:hypothetical protein